MRKTLSPAFVLFFLAPVIPELLTGSTPLANCGVAVMPEDIYCRECGGKL